MSEEEKRQLQRLIITLWQLIATATQPGLGTVQDAVALSGRLIAEIETLKRIME